MVFQNTFYKGFKLKTVLTRLLSTKTKLPKTIFLERLSSRAVLKINGSEVEDYLQGLITNDIKHLHDGSPSIYAMFLNSRGRVLYDSIIYKMKEPETFLIECDTMAAESLKKHLMMYRVRRKIALNPEENFKPWVISSNKDTEDKYDIKHVSESLNSSLSNCLVCTDPRLTNLGVRILAPKEVSAIDLMKKVKDFEVVSDNFYKSLRYKLGVGEGVNELPPGNCLPLEANCDYLNGISFHKGCYIGQELTARTYHTGVIRKRLMPISFDEKIDCTGKDVPIYASDRADKSVGKLRGIEGNLGIGLMRIEEALRAPELTILGKISRTSRPFWWPSGASNENFKLKQIMAEELIPIEKEGEKREQEEAKEEIGEETKEEEGEEAEEGENGVMEKWFQCSGCSLRERYDIKGTNFPPIKNITLKEPSYIMADSFSEKGKVNMIILGSDCAMCNNPICQSPDCSIYFLKRYCQRCGLKNKYRLPEQLHRKLKFSEMN